MGLSFVGGFQKCGKIGSVDAVGTNRIIGIPLTTPQLIHLNRLQSLFLRYPIRSSIQFRFPLRYRFVIRLLAVVGNRQFAFVLWEQLQELVDGIGHSSRLFLVGGWVLFVALVILLLWVLV